MIQAIMLPRLEFKRECTQVYVFDGMTFYEPVFKLDVDATIEKLRAQIHKDIDERFDRAKYWRLYDETGVMLISR